MKKIQISPSILSADFSQLGNEIKRLEEGGADMIHVDVMDGHFVPNLTIGPPVIKALRNQCSLKFDVHLMISPVHKYIESYAEAGADITTIHPEATDNLEDSILKIKQLNKNPLRPLIICWRGSPNFSRPIKRKAHLIELTAVGFYIRFRSYRRMLPRLNRILLCG